MMKLSYSLWRELPQHLKQRQLWFHTPDPFAHGLILQHPWGLAPGPPGDSTIHGCLRLLDKIKQYLHVIYMYPPAYVSHLSIICCTQYNVTAG